MRKLTLEQRIARLEKLLNKNSRSRKYESRIDDFYDAVDSLYEQGIEDIDDMVEPLAKLGFKVTLDDDYDNKKVFSWMTLRDASANAWAKRTNLSKLDGEDEPKDLESSVESWFDDNMGPDMYDSKRAWMSDLRYMSKGSPNGSEADDCCDAVGCNDIDKVTELLAKLAKDTLNDISYNKAHGQDSVGRVWTDPWA